MSNHQIQRVPGQSDEVFDQLQIIFYYIIAIGMMNFSCYLLTPKKQSIHQRLYLAAIYLWVPLLPLMIGSALYAVISLGPTLEDRWYGTTQASFLFMRIYVACQVTGVANEL